MVLSPYSHATDEHVHIDRYLKSPRVFEQIVVKSTLQTLAVPAVCVVSMLSAALPLIRKSLLTLNTEERTRQSTTTRLYHFQRKIGHAPHIFALRQTRPPTVTYCTSFYSTSLGSRRCVVVHCTDERLPKHIAVHACTLSVSLGSMNIGDSREGNTTVDVYMQCPR